MKKSRTVSLAFGALSVFAAACGSNDSDISLSSSTSMASSPTSATTPSPTAPPGRPAPPVATTTTEVQLPTAVVDDYCNSPGEVGTTSDGYTAYCVRVQYTDAYVWSLSNELVPRDPNAPSAPPAVIGDYCTPAGAIGISSDGSTAYCVRVQYTDAYVWSLTDALVPKDPNAAPAPSPGDDCFNPNAVTADTEGRTIYCNPTVNGRNAGNLVWQLQP